MSTTYKPGTVAWATVRGESTYKVLRVTTRTGLGWTHSETSGGFTFSRDEHVTDVRPLVVLDLGAWLPEYVAKFPEWLRSKEADAPSGSLLCHLANEIEAQTRPARIPEPGLWGVVRDGDGERYVREAERPKWRWNPIGKGRNVTWDDIVDPVLIRDGIEDGAA